MKLCKKLFIYIVIYCLVRMKGLRGLYITVLALFQRKKRHFFKFVSQKNYIILHKNYLVLKKGLKAKYNRVGSTFQRKKRFFFYITHI